MEIHIGRWAILSDDDITHPTFPTEIAAEEYAGVHGGLVVGIADNVEIIEVD